MEKGGEGFITINHPSFYTILPCPATPTIITRPRVLAYIRKSCRVEFTPRYDICNDSDMQVIELFGKEPFYVVNVYNEKERLASPPVIPSNSVPLLNAVISLNSVPLSNAVISPNTYTGKYTVDRLLHQFRPDKPAIIAGDFNLHHPWWNCTASPTKASKAMKLVKWLEAMKATLLINTEEINLKGGTYHKPDLKSTSIIDLAFYTSFKKLVWGKWSFIEHTGSDHEAIAFEASLAESPQPTNTETRKPNYNYKKADWNQFFTTLRAMEYDLLQTIEIALF